MKKIYDSGRIANNIKNCSIGFLLDDMIDDVFIIEYDAGEIISLDSIFQIVISGDFSIYLIREDGSRYALTSGSRNYIIGETELFNRKNSNIFAEASEKLTSLAFYVTEEKKETLYKNARFMKTIANILASKIEAIAHFDASSISLKDRVINYMRFRCENNTLHGIEQASFQLHCSSRQLQRILNGCESEGIVIKVGKGRYILNK